MVKFSIQISTYSRDSHLETLSLPNHRLATSNVMSDAVEMTYLDRSKRRQQEMKSSTNNEVDAIPKNGSNDELQQQQLTTQSTFIDITDMPSIKDPNCKVKNSRKVSTTTNDTNRKRNI